MSQLGNTITKLPPGCTPISLNFIRHTSASYFPVLAEVALQKCYTAVSGATFSIGPHCADFSGITADALAYTNGNKAFIVGSVRQKTGSIQQSPLGGWHVSCMAEEDHNDFPFMSAATTWIDGSFLAGQERLFLESNLNYISCRLGEARTPYKDWKPKNIDMEHMVYAGELDLPN
uniref:Uncharacterized protein n=1 Tax=Tetradesmus obliquus TaxID=3088 RepID=A0A383VR91_TETOB